MFRKLLAVVLCAALCVSILPVLSISSSADNSGFIQIRIFYKIRLSDGSYGEEASVLVTDGSYLILPVSSPYNQVLITRFQIRNDSNTLGYYQFDICAGGQVPISGGTYPSIYCSGWEFSNSSSINAFTLPAMDDEDFSYISGAVSVNEPRYTTINCGFSRTFFGKTNRSGYINFTSPHMLLMLNPNSSPSPSYMYIFFRNVITGIDSSGYLANMEQYLSNIDSNVDQITDWMEEEHAAAHDFLDAGGQDLLDDAAAFAPSGFGVIGALFGVSSIISINPGTYSFQNRFWTEWAHNQMQGTSTRSTNDDDDDYIDFFEQNKNQYWAGD